LEYLKACGQITPSEYCTLTGMQESTAHQNLQSMVSKGIVMRQGKGAWHPLRVESSNSGRLEDNSGDDLYDILTSKGEGPGVARSGTARTRRLMREHGLAELHLEDLDVFLPSRSTAPATASWI
jgi:hypothetical protein